MPQWFTVLKNLSYTNEDDDICCSEARKKYLNLFGFYDDSDDTVSFRISSKGRGKGQKIERTEGRSNHSDMNWNLVGLIKDLSCEDLNKIFISHDSIMGMHKLHLNTKIGKMAVLIGDNKVNTIKEIKEQWKECNDDLV